MSAGELIGENAPCAICKRIYVLINALDDSWNRIISLDDMPSNTTSASLYYDDCDCDTIQGYIDEFRIYDRALTPAEVLNNMKTTGLDVSPNASHLSVTWGHMKARRR